MSEVPLAVWVAAGLPAAAGYRDAPTLTVHACETDDARRYRRQQLWSALLHALALGLWAMLPLLVRLGGWLGEWEDWR